MENGELFTHDGRTFKFVIENDETADMPWDMSDGHGPVRWARVDRSAHDVRKRPGERAIYSTGFQVALYDWAAAVKIAKRDHWGVNEFGTLPHTELLTAGQIAERAVQQDFDRLRAFTIGDWTYVGVVVTLIDEDGKTERRLYRESLWGIESDATEYLDDTAHELAGEICERMK